MAEAVRLLINMALMSFGLRLWGYFGQIIRLNCFVTNVTNNHDVSLTLPSV